MRAAIHRFCQWVIDWLEKPDPMWCSPVAASWCPKCGDCTCRNPEDSRNDWDCPLHGINSKHADGRS